MVTPKELKEIYQNSVANNIKAADDRFNEVNEEMINAILTVVKNTAQQGVEKGVDIREVILIVGDFYNKFELKCNDGKIMLDRLNIIKDKLQQRGFKFCELCTELTDYIVFEEQGE